MSVYVGSAMDERFCEISENDGYKYDIDLIKEELDYYIRKEEDGGISKARENDSTMERPHIRPIQIASVKSNGTRRTTSTCKTSRRGVALKNLHNVELLRYRACGEQYLLTEDRLIYHLISFIDIHYDGPTAYDDPPFFSVCNDAIVIDANYHYTDENPRSRYSEEHFVNMATPYLSTHIELREIMNFVDKLEQSTTIPAFWEVFLIFMHNFFADYRKSLSTLRKCEGLSIAGLLDLTKPFRQCVHLIHSLFCSWFEVHKFEWIHIELAWNNLFALMNDCAGKSEAEVSMIIQLQEMYQDVLLKIMDYLYSFGKVPLIWEKYFILYNDPSDPELLITRTEHGVVSSLWNDRLLCVVLHGARTRVRIGANIDLTPLFSDVFYDRLKVEGLKVGSFISFHNFRYAFESTAVTVTHMLSSELITKIRNSGLLDYWNDMKEITCGRVAHCFAALVYGCSSDPSKIGKLDVAQSYRSALLCGGISPARAAKWRLAQAGASDTDYDLHCDFDLPLNYVFRPSLLPVINACMDNVFKIYRVVELLTSVCSDRKTSGDCQQIHDDQMIAKKRVRHMFFIVSKLLNLTSIIKELFIEKVASVFSKHEKVLKSSDDVEEVDNTLRKAEFDLHSLVARTDIRKQFHEVVDIMKRLAEEIRLKSVSNDLTIETLIRWHKTTVRTIEFLDVVGSAMPIDSVFHALHLKLAYRREYVRYPSSAID